MGAPNSRSGRLKAAHTTAETAEHASFELDDETTMDFRAVENACNINQGHIHFGSEDENGPVVVRLYAQDAREPEPIEGRFTGVLAEGTITAEDLIDELEGEPLGAFVDVMIDGLAQNLAGEIRG